MARKADDLKGKLNIEFFDEEAVDAGQFLQPIEANLNTIGGVTREWFLSLSREMLNPNYALFQHAANSATFQPNPQSSVNQDHLQFFKFVGRIIGKVRYIQIERG